MILTLCLLLLGSALARDAGVELGEDWVAGWSREGGVALYPADRLDEMAYRWEPRGAVDDVLAWEGLFLVLVEGSGFKRMWRLDPGAGLVEDIADTRWVQSMVLDPADGALLLADARGALYRVEVLQREDGEWLTSATRRDPVPQPVLGPWVNQILHRGPDSLIAGSPSGLFVAERGGGGWDRSIRGFGSHPVHDLALLSRSRLVTVDRAGTEADPLWSVTRWSLFHPEAPWPFPLGTYALPGPYLGRVPLPDGIWLLGPQPIEPLPHLPGVIYGAANPEDPAIAGALLPSEKDGPKLLLLNRDLALRRAAPPATGAPPPTLQGDNWTRAVEDWAALSGSGEAPAAEALALRIRKDDLPMGLEVAPGGSMPEWGRQTILELLEMAGPLNHLPLIIAQGYLERFPDPDGEIRRTLDRARSRVIRRQVSFFGGLMAVGALLFWAGRLLRRRIVQRDRVLAAGWNPFRQDSPNNPERTPFAANSLVDDVLRTLERNCAMVEGPQFSGKSALLRHLSWRLRQEGLGDRPARVVEVGLYGIPEEEFWTVLGRRIIEVYPEAEASEEVAELSALDRGAVEYLLDEVLEDTGPRLVLVLDDLDTLGLYEAEAQRFRGLLQVVPSHRMSVLGAGMSIRRGFAGAEDESPWFNLFQVRPLRPLTFEELRDYLDLRLEPPYSYTAEAAARIQELTDGRPLQVWHICFAAIDSLLLARRLDLQLKDVDGASEELRALAGVFVRSNRNIRGGPPAGQDAESAWEQVVQHLAEARRRRGELLTRLARRQQARQDAAISSFFDEEVP